MPTSAPYIPRTLEPVLARALEQFPAVVLTGPRQAGKTTLLRHLLEGSARYVALDLPDVRAAAEADPRGFLDLHPAPVILDEIQACPSLLPYLRERIDQRRSEPGRYILSGSQNLLLMEAVTESLAGRSAVLTLLPLSQRELTGEAQRTLCWEEGGAVMEPAKRPLEAQWSSYLQGGFPELAASGPRDLDLWHGSYVRTYLERDVRRLRNVGDLGAFQAFMQALAARSAQLLSLSELSRDLGVAVNTVKAWLSVLEASHQIVVLRPYHANIGKRLVKTPKVYFTDVGTLCYLTGVRSWELAARGPLAGAIFETAVFSELYKAAHHRGQEPRLWFWRTSTGQEVDFLVQQGTKLVPVEVKAGATVRPPMAAGIHALRRDLGDAVLPGWVVYQGEQRLPMGEGVQALPFEGL